MSITTLFLIIGGALIIAEIVADFSIVWLLLLGVAAFLVSITDYFYGLTPYSALGFYLLFTATLVVVLYKPVKRYTRRGHKTPAHDMIGRQVTVTKAVSMEIGGMVNFSGTSWNAVLAENCQEEKQPDTTATVVSVKDITLYVE